LKGKSKGAVFKNTQKSSISMKCEEKGILYLFTAKYTNYLKKLNHRENHLNPRIFMSLTN
jgi:hypothetical protein